MPNTQVFPKPIDSSLAPSGQDQEGRPCPSHVALHGYDLHAGDSCLYVIMHTVSPVCFFESRHAVDYSQQAFLVWCSTVFKLVTSKTTPCPTVSCLLLAHAIMIYDVDIISEP